MDSVILESEERKELCKNYLEYLTLKSRIVKTRPHVCYYCNRPLVKREITLDHLIPLSKNGKSVESNLVICCPNCNHEKGDMTEKEYLKYKRQQNNIPQKDFYFDELLDLDKIRIPKPYARSVVKKNLLNRVYQYYNKYKMLDQPIMIKSRSDILLLDGYARYVVAKNKMLDLVPIVYVYD